MDYLIVLALVPVLGVAAALARTDVIRREIALWRWRRAAASRVLRWDPRLARR